jgi:putative transposase
VGHRFPIQATADSCNIKFLNVFDKYSRLCLAIRVRRRCKAKNLVAVLEGLTILYPALRTSAAMKRGIHLSGYRSWCEASNKSKIVSSKPQSLWGNSFAESVNRRFRDEFLNTELYTKATEAQLITDRWLWKYNK